MSTLPLLNTERLLLRPLEDQDNKTIQFLRSDKRVNAFVKRPTTNTLQEAADFIDKIRNGVSHGDWFFWAITRKSDPELIGTICLWNFASDRKLAEVGYDLHPDFQQKGIMSEALQSVLHYGFNTLQLECIEAYTHRANAPSTNLLTKHNFVLYNERIDKDNLDNSIFSLQRDRYTSS